MSDRTFRRRFRWSGVALFLLMGGLAGRLAALHLQVDPEVRAELDRARAYEEEILVRRGTIYDCRGTANILGTDVERYDVCVDPFVLQRQKSATVAAGRLAGVLQRSEPELLGAIGSSTGRYMRIARCVPLETAEAVRSLKLAGVSVRETYMRDYPHGRFLCHVLGFVNDERVGSAGVEQRFNSYLRGSGGFVQSAKDGLRKELTLRRNLFIPAIQGADVTLTIDQNVQFIVEQVLDEVMAEHHAKGAWAIVQRVHTGEILAMAARPAYDLNDFRHSHTNERINRAIGHVYEPGSTLKVVAISAALSRGIVRPETVFDCENGSWLYAGKILRDYHPYGRLTVAQGVQKSSNILTAKVAILLGAAPLHASLRAFGLGEPLKFDLPGEEGGILRPLQDWAKVSTTRVAIGQGVAVTALQMIAMFSAIANGGALMRPYVVSRVTGADGTEYYRGEPEVLSRPLTSENAALMRALLKAVTDDGGTGKRARVEGYEVAGKTGTAQKAVAGGYSQTDYVASFVGFLPASSPEIALIVVVDEPQPFHTGGVVAGPAFSRIADQTVRCLGIPPEGLERLAALE